MQWSTLVSYVGSSEGRPSPREVRMAGIALERLRARRKDSRAQAREGAFSPGHHSFPSSLSGRQGVLCRLCSIEIGTLLSFARSTACFSLAHPLLPLLSDMGKATLPAHPATPSPAFPVPGPQEDAQHTAHRWSSATPFCSTAQPKQGQDR